MLSTVGLVLGFKTTSHLAAAYGVAVNFTMMVTTILFYIVARKKFKWNFLSAFSLSALFLIIELAFFGANISKVMHGAWFPLLIGAIFFEIMLTWEKGRKILYEEIKLMTIKFEEFQKSLKEIEHTKVTGDAVFLTGRPDVVPFALLQNLKHNKVIHSETYILHIRFRNVPRVPNLKKIEVEKLGGGFFRIIANYGYMEDPNITNIIILAKDQGLPIEMDGVSYFLGRERLILEKDKRMAMWRKRLYKLMSTLSADFTTFSGIPTSRVIEIGVELKL